MPEIKPEILRRETYLKMIENSVGSRIFNSLIAKVGLETKDLLGNGEFSCAVFVSSILFLNKMLPTQRATVDNLERDLDISEFYYSIPLNNYLPIRGDIMIWSKNEFIASHRHIGFVFSENEAISTSYKEKCVVKHPLEYNFKDPEIKRKIEKIFRYKF